MESLSLFERVAVLLFQCFFFATLAGVVIILTVMGTFFTEMGVAKIKIEGKILLFRMVSVVKWFVYLMYWSVGMGLWWAISKESIQLFIEACGTSPLSAVAILCVGVAVGFICFMGVLRMRRVD